MKEQTLAQLLEKLSVKEGGKKIAGKRIAGKKFAGSNKKGSARPVHYIPSDLEGGAWYDFLDPTKNGVGDIYNKVKHEVVDADSKLRKEILPVVIEGVKTAVSVANTAKSLMGKGKPDGRKVRGALIAKLMKEHPDWHMTDASKHIKEHGLYKA